MYSNKNKRVPEHFAPKDTSLSISCFI